MRTVRVELGSRSYDVRIGSDIIAQFDEAIPLAGLGDATSFTVIGDRATGGTISTVANALARAHGTVHTIALDVSEKSKSPDVLDSLYGELISHGVDRRGVIVAVGGGVIGDLAGYLAATYLRGVRWIGVPTTLLAAVDSSIGGKTGINHALGKNLIGAIHQPSLVVIDRLTFTSLPGRELVSGYGEMLKYGLALDRRLWEDLVSIRPDEIGDSQIERCVARKATIVAGDESDRLGQREILNFGHTIGHALEAVTGYAYFRHGEAVVLGMRAALTLSVARGHCSAQVAAKADAHLAAVPVPALPKLDHAEVLAAVMRDKKKSAPGRIRFVLLHDIGETVSDDGVDAAAIGSALDMLEASCASAS
jgi:3-dehydroquinate synthase